MFPRFAALLAVLTGLFNYWLVGWSAWLACGAAFALFLSVGGARYLRLLSRVLPRDVRYILLLVKIKKMFQRCQDERLILSDLFTQVVSRHPDKTAVIYVDDGRRWSFRELEEYANRVAHHFRNLGVGKGDVVAVFVENCPEHIGLSLGLWKIGAVTAYINTNLRQNTLVHCINLAQSKYLVYSTSLTEHLTEIAAQLEGALADAPMFYVRGSNAVEGGTLERGRDLESELEKVSHLAPPALQDKSFHDLTAYVYSSGTTGLPKACRVTISRAYLSSVGLGTLARLTTDDVIYNCLPLYHTAGGVIVLGNTLFRGCTMVLRRKFSATNFFNDCVKYDCTAIQYIGEICRYLLSRPKQDTDGINPVKTAIGNGLRPEIWMMFKNRFQIDHIVEFYGATEGLGACGNHNDKPGSVGHFIMSIPFPQHTFLVKRVPTTGDYVRNERGYLVQTDINEPGELISLIDDASPFQKYPGYSDRNASESKVIRNVFKEGDAYFKSGDILRMDAEGYLYFCDRTGDTFRWKGENVSTTEVEGTMQTIIGLKDVLVFGVLIPGTDGRAGMAVITSDENSLEISQLAPKLQRALPPYAVPLFVRLTKSIPLTSTYKLKKTQVRDEGYDLERVSDPVFLLHPSNNRYVRLTRELVRDMENGKLRF